jgi:hypothetical protein
MQEKVLELFSNILLSAHYIRKHSFLLWETNVIWPDYLLGFLQRNFSYSTVLESKK